VILDNYGKEVPEEDLRPRSLACPECFKVVERLTITGFGGMWKRLCSSCGYRYEGADIRAEES
jgi:hypothetical protein